MTTSESDSIVTLDHLSSTSIVTAWRIVLASSSSTNPPYVELCHPPHISPSWFRAMTHIPHGPMSGHHNVSQLILITLLSGRVHLSVVWALPCPAGSCLKTFISPHALWISATMFPGLGVFVLKNQFASHFPYRPTRCYAHLPLIPYPDSSCERWRDAVNEIQSARSC